MSCLRISEKKPLSPKRWTGPQTLVGLLDNPTVMFKSKWCKLLTLEFLRGIRNLFSCHGKHLKGVDCTQSQLHIIRLFSKFDDLELVKVVKYFTSVHLPQLVGDTLPERPGCLSTSDTLFSGVYGLVHKSLLRGRAGVNYTGSHLPQKKSLSYAFGLLQIKRKLPPLSDKCKLAARKSHKATLTKPGKTPSVLLDQVARTTMELFPLGWDGKSLPSYSISNKSCLESSRKDGGAQAHMFSLTGEFKESRVPHQMEDDLFGHDIELPRADTAVTTAAYEEIAFRTQPTLLRSKVEIVEDPLKARVITKNNWQCTTLKPLQKLIHSRLRSIGPFCLIGETITSEIMDRLDLFPKSRFVSGDYSAATDNLHSDVTETCLDIILGNMTGPLSRKTELIMLAKRSLTGLRILNEMDKDLIEYDMLRGQLMGSLLSFPILCIINFSIWRHATESTFGTKCDGMGRGGRHDHVLINGDDIGFCATNNQYKRWCSLVPLVGLEPSPGKNYFCREFITLNTRLFKFDKNEKKMKAIPFLNQGLLTKNTTPNDIMRLETLGKLHDDFVAGAQCKSAASMIFIGDNKKNLKMTWRNLFGPKRNGGLGATPISDQSKRSDSFTPLQLIIAKRLRDSNSTLPTPGVEGRYSAYEKRIIDDRFKDCQELSEEEVIESELRGAQWVSVQDRVETLRARFLSEVSWLNPYEETYRDTYRPLNQLKQQALKYVKRNRSFRMSVSDYLAPVSPKSLYKFDRLLFSDAFLF
jgi:hypothetical protein